MWTLVDLDRFHPIDDKALACYRSAEYQAAKKFLDKVGEVELVVVPGYDGPQPS